jgi:hypothetical protein
VEELLPRCSLDLIEKTMRTEKGPVMACPPRLNTSCYSRSPQPARMICSPPRTWGANALPLSALPNVTLKMISLTVSGSPERKPIASSGRSGAAQSHGFSP